MPEQHLAMHRLYLANRRGLPFAAPDRRAVVAALLSAGLGATVTDGVGLWAGRSLPTLVLHVAATGEALRALAGRLRRRFGQHAIALEAGGAFELLGGRAA